MRFSAFATACFLVVATSCNLAAADPVRLGILANRGELAAKTQWSDFAAWTGEQLGRPGELVPLPIGGVAPIIAQGGVDLVICNPGLAARIVIESKAVPLATWKAKDGAVRMAGVILVNPQAGITTIEQLKGRKVMTYGDDSAGAWQFQAALMISRGLDPGKDIVRTISKKQDDIVLAVKAGVFDAGFVRNGVFEDLVARGKLATSDVTVLEVQPVEAGFTHVRSTPFYPEWFLLASAKLDAASATKLAQACIALPAGTPALAKADITGWVAPLELEQTTALLKLLKLPPFDR